MFFKFDPNPYIATEEAKKEYSKLCSAYLKARQDLMEFFEKITAMEIIPEKEAD